MFRPRARMHPLVDHGFQGVRYFRRRVCPDITFLQKQICTTSRPSPWRSTPSSAGGVISSLPLWPLLPFASPLPVLLLPGAVHLRKREKRKQQLLSTTVSCSWYRKNPCDQALMIRTGLAYVHSFPGVDGCNVETVEVPHVSCCNGEVMSPRSSRNQRIAEVQDTPASFRISRFVRKPSHRRRTCQVSAGRWPLALARVWRSVDIS